MADEKNPAKRPLGVVPAGERVAAGKEDDVSIRDTSDVPVNEQIDALRSELARLRESAGLVAEGTGQLALSQARSVRDDVEELVVTNPFTALLGAAFVGYLFGLRHR